MNRLAAWVLAREPGRRLPRRSYLAGSHQATAAAIDAAVAELARRGIVRETADGNLYRASPAECLVTFDGLARAGCCVDPAGGVLACISRNVTRRSPPEEIAHACGCLRTLRYAPSSPRGAWAAPPPRCPRPTYPAR